MYNHKSAHNWNEPSESRLQGFEMDKLACSVASAIRGPQFLDLLHYTQICFCLGSFKL
jgi:hypothetical protein